MVINRLKQFINGNFGRAPLISISAGFPVGINIRNGLASHLCSLRGFQGLESQVQRRNECGTEINARHQSCAELPGSSCRPPPRSRPRYIWVLGISSFSLYLDILVHSGSYLLLEMHYTTYIIIIRSLGFSTVSTVYRSPEFANSTEIKMVLTV